jgi:hypothetical protein
MPGNGIRALSGVPVWDYLTPPYGGDDTNTAEFLWQKLYDSNDLGYILGTGTFGGDDSMSNDCGIAFGHAYSVIAAFEMTDAAGTVHKCVLVRNPWGTNGYSWTWSYDDPNWTADLIAQVPHGFDPTAQVNTETGLFVVPMEAYQDNADVGYCLHDIQIGHYRADEGYTNTWIDCIDCGAEEYQYSYTASTNTYPIYFILETYYN